MSPNTEGLREPDIRQFLREDLLCGAALYAMGCIATQLNKPALDWFVGSTFVEPGLPGPWVSALTAAMVESPDRFEDIALCARRFAGESIIQLLIEYDLPDTARNIWREVQAIFESLPTSSGPHKAVRITRKGLTDYDVFLRTDFGWIFREVGTHDASWVEVVQTLA